MRNALTLARAAANVPAPVTQRSPRVRVSRLPQTFGPRRHLYRRGPGRVTGSSSRNTAMFGLSERLGGCRSRALCRLRYGGPGARGPCRPVLLTASARGFLTLEGGGLGRAAAIGQQQPLSLQAPITDRNTALCNLHPAAQHCRSQTRLKRECHRLYTLARILAQEALQHRSGKGQTKSTPEPARSRT